MLLPLLLLACPAAVDSTAETDPPGDSEPPGPEDCGDGVDNDADGRSDCDDEDCDEECAEICDDGLDNDADGRIDCRDVDCDGRCPEVCDDDRDNDGDGLSDCDDPDCDGKCPEACDNDEDDDGDGLVDCDDPDCKFPATCPEICDDARDNDGDGLTDCDDFDCDGGCEEDCRDARDNDADRFIDCDDPDCATACAEDCHGTGDGDGDGRIGCEDEDCATSPPCIEVCDDGIDNERDGLVDCWDSDCWGICPELCGAWSDADADGLRHDVDPDCAYRSEGCEDGYDEDGDGLVDCEDGDCADASVCVEDCDNHEDDDDDGLVDCADDDCWGPDCVGSTVAFVLAGRVTGRRAVNRRRAYWDLHGGLRVTRVERQTVADVVGEVRVLDGYGGALATCSWWADEVRVIHWTSESTGGGPTGPWGNFAEAMRTGERLGFGVGGGCPVSSSGFLPANLVPGALGLALPELVMRPTWTQSAVAPRWLHVSDDLWYVGVGAPAVTATSSHAWTHRRGSYSSPYLARFYETAVEFSWPALEPTPEGFYAR